MVENNAANACELYTEKRKLAENICKHAFAKNWAKHVVFSKRKCARRKLEKNGKREQRRRMLCFFAHQISNEKRIFAPQLMLMGSLQKLQILCITVPLYVPICRECVHRKVHIQTHSMMRIVLSRQSMKAVIKGVHAKRPWPHIRRRRKRQRRKPRRSKCATNSGFLTALVGSTSHSSPSRTSSSYWQWYAEGAQWKRRRSRRSPHTRRRCICSQHLSSSGEWA